MASSWGYTLFLTAREILLALRSPQHSARVVRMKWTGASTSPQIVGRDQLPGKSNYFLGQDPRSWHTNVPLYQRVEYSGVYPGVDLSFYGNQQELEYDIVIRPRSDPRQVAFAFEGAGRLELDAQGDITIRTGDDEVTLRKPAIYQFVDKMRQLVEGGYELRGKNEIGFRLGHYDCHLQLVIDPSLAYATFLGGRDDDSAASVAVDSSGNAYIAGSTKSLDFPTQPQQSKPGGTGNYDVFVAKIDTTKTGLASLVYSTFLGGSNDDRALGIAVDNAGDAVFTGVTYSPNFPTKNAFKAGFAGAKDTSDITVTKLDPTGSNLVFSTYFGGSGTEGTANAGGVAVDGASDIYVTSDTESADLFTTTGALQGNLKDSSDAFVAKFSATGSVLYASYLGGSSSETGNGIAVDTAGTVYVAGSTSSSDLAPKNQCSTLPPAYSGGASDGFVARLDPTAAGPAQLLYLVLLGGIDQDRAQAIVVDSASPANAYVTGDTRSSNFPVTSGSAFQATAQGRLDVFVTVLNLGRNGLVCPTYSTYLGGATGDDSGRGIAVNTAGKIYVTGQTSSSDFPKQNPIQASIGGPQDAFVAKLDPTASGPASLLYSTYLGGSSTDGGAAIAVDNQGNAYAVGATTSPDFPVIQTSAFQPSCKGCGGTSTLADAFLAKISDAGAVPALNFNPPEVVFGDVNVGSSSAPVTIALSNGGNATLTINQIAVTGGTDFSETNDCPSSLAGGAPSCAITVTFTPTSPAAETAAITVSDNAAGSPQSLPLLGTGVAPVAHVSPTQINFGSQPQGTTSNAIPVTLTNSGNSPLSISTINISGLNTNDFSPTTDNCPVAPGTLAGGASCVVSVVFTPSSTGPRSAHLNFADNSDNSPSSAQVIPLAGTGTPPSPVANLLPSSHDFGSVNVGGVSSATNVTLVNSGNLTLQITNIQMMGNGDFTFAPAQSPACTLGAASQLSANSSCNLAATFNPSAFGPESAQIVVTDDSGNTGGTTQTTSLTGVGAAPIAGVSPASLTFSSQLVGTTSSGSPVALKNTGTGPLSYVVSFSGADAADFAESDNCSGNVNAGASCNLMVTFTPKAAGTRNTILVVTDNSSGVSKSQQTVPVSGNATDFSMRVANGGSTSVTISAGQNATYNLQIVPSSGFTGPVSLQCTGAPPLSSCTPSSDSVTLTNASPLPFQVIVTTTAFVPPTGAPGSTPWVPLLALVLSVLCLQLTHPSKRLAPVFASILFVFLLLVGCGGMGGGNTPSGTPSGSYTLTVTGSQNGSSRTLSLTLQVK